MDFKKLQKLMDEAFKEKERYYKTPEGIIHLKRLRAHNAKWNLYPEKIHNFLETLDDKEFNKLAERFIENELAYKDRMYTNRHVETSSIMYNFLFDIAIKHGKYTSKPEMFSDGYYKYRGYKFTLVCGQGSFIELTKGTKRII